MNKIKSLWTIILAGITSVVPFLLSCPGLACVSCGRETPQSTAKCCSNLCSKRYYKQQKLTAKVKTITQQTISIINSDIEKIKVRDFLSISQCAELLGISRFTVMRLARTGLIASFKAGRRTIISRESINNQFNINNNESNT